MPTQTFRKLPEEKKEKILKAAKKEFARVPIEEVSIKNIVNEAEIARGSFYQYFESKEDLLKYMIQSNIELVEAYIEKELIQKKGDIFEVYIAMFDYITKKLIKKEEVDLYSMIFQNIRISEETSVMLKKKECVPKGPFPKSAFVDKIDKDKLSVKNEEELKIMIKMLFLTIREALVFYFKGDNLEKVRREYVQMIEYLKYGVIKR
ncbi:MAG: TetR/AcrR family transcriptional regulator [Clostridia bacterium]|nr:TetR/AcrR family transcriptional regulator [Clostridia bacterium]